MRDVAMNCKNHPNLRWTAKVAAIGNSLMNPGEPAEYNGRWNLYFIGCPITDQKTYGIQPTFPECDCPVEDLLIAPEDVTGIIYSDCDLESEEGETKMLEAMDRCYNISFEFAVNSLKPNTFPHHD